MVKRVIILLLLFGLAAVGAGLLWCRAKTETVTYAADTSAFSNAVMGFAPTLGSETDATVYYLGLTWREWEPEEGAYAWEALDEKYGLTALRESGVHLVLRFICDYPRDEAHLDIPDWLYAQTGDGSFYDTSYGKGYSPDYSNAIFRAAHTKAIAALGAYFDGFACYVELGSLGHWGEWHIKSGEGLVPMPDEEIRNEYVSTYIAAFSSAKLLMRRPFTIAAQEGLGVYNDMTGEPEATAEWLDWLEQGGSYGSEENALTAMPEFWLTAPVGGEFTSSLSMEEMLGSELTRTLELLEASHMTFLGPKIPDTQEQGYSDVLAALGYRLRIESAVLRRSPFGAVLTLTWTNDGAAPFYFDWDAEVTAETDNGTAQTVTLPLKLSSLAPGTTQTVRVRFSDVREKLFSATDTPLRITVGIVDPMTGQYAVRLAMQADRTTDGQTILLDIP